MSYKRQYTHQVLRYQAFKDGLGRRYRGVAWHCGWKLTQQGQHHLTWVTVVNSPLKVRRHDQPIRKMRPWLPQTLAPNIARMSYHRNVCAGSTDIVEIGIVGNQSKSTIGCLFRPPAGEPAGVRAPHQRRQQCESLDRPLENKQPGHDHSSGARFRHHSQKLPLKWTVEGFHPISTTPASARTWSISPAVAQPFQNRPIGKGEFQRNRTQASDKCHGIPPGRASDCFFCMHHQPCLIATSRETAFEHFVLTFAMSYYSEKLPMHTHDPHEAKPRNHYSPGKLIALAVIICGLVRLAIDDPLGVASLGTPNRHSADVRHTVVFQFRPDVTPGTLDGVGALSVSFLLPG